MGAAPFWALSPLRSDATRPAGPTPQARVGALGRETSQPRAPRPQPGVGRERWAPPRS